MSSSITPEFSYNKLTDDFEKLEIQDKDSYIGDKFVIQPIDYLTMIIGARDYGYLIHENNNMLDNEVTSLFPIVSYPMLQFILFMLSLKNPYISYLFKFRKDKIHGIHSEVFFKTINQMYKKYPIPEAANYNNSVNHRRLNKGFNFYHDNDIENITYNLSSRPFSFLTLPTKFILNDLPYNEEAGDSKYIELFCKKTRMITNQLYAPKLKLMYLMDLEFVLKNDILAYLPRFYYNRYNEYYEELVRNGVFGGKLLKSLKHPDNEYSRQEHSRYMTKTDLQKMNINIVVNESLVKGYIENRKMLCNRLGVPLENEEEIKQDLFYKLKQDYKYKKIDSIDELYEFYIKSILIRRPARAKVNTLLNRTNGIYLLHNGVARFRELLTMEMLFHRRIIDNSVINVTGRSIEIRYNGKKTRLSFSSVIDLNNKPFLLSEKLMKLIDTIYGNKYELHGLIKYAEIYGRIFNQFGNNVIWFLLGTELTNYTGFNLQKHVMGKDTKIYKDTGYTFVNFEKLLEKEPALNYLFKKLKHSNLYTKKREDMVRTKFLLT